MADLHTTSSIDNPALGFDDPASILASYAPPEAELIAPVKPGSESSTSGTSISIPISLPESKSKETFKSAPIAYIEPATRSTKVIHRDVAPILSNAGVRGMVTNVSHGTFNSRPATLVVFSFVFRSGEHAFRFQSANIKVTFATRETSSDSKPALTSAGPAVVKFAPRKIFGLPTVEGRRNMIGGEFTMQVPAGPVVIGPTVRAERETNYQKSYRFSTVGNFWSSKHSTDWDIVYWDIRENGRTKDRIPDQFNAAVIIERDEGEAAKAFTAMVEVTIDTPMCNGFSGWPFTRDRPVAFKEGVEMGAQPSVREFEKLTEEQWRALAPTNEEWESRFTDVAPNHREGARPAVAGGEATPLAVDINLLEAEASDDR